MRARTGRVATGAVTATVLLALAAPAGAQTGDERPGLRDVSYVFPLGAPAATPDCVLVLCPLIRALGPETTGPDAGTSGLRVVGLPLASGRVVAESRSEPVPYDGGDRQGITAIRLSADVTAAGSGGTVRTSVRLEEQGGGTVAELPPVVAPLDGLRHAGVPVVVDRRSLSVGRVYVAVARFAFEVPFGGDVRARVHPPRLLVQGPRRTDASTPLRPARPAVRLRGRELQVTARCPSGRARCEVRIRSTAGGRTLGTGRRELQAAARHTFRLRLSDAGLRAVRRAGTIVTTLRAEDETGRVGTARRTLRPAR